VFTLVPGAAEGGGSFLSAPRVQKPIRGLEAEDPERAAHEASRRARREIRRYGVANRLTRLGSLTYRGAGCHDFDEHYGNLARFFRKLRAGLGGERFPYLAVQEWHPGGHGLHGHFLVGRYIQRGLIEEAWPHGFVHIKLIGNLPAGSGELGEARTAARYVAGYLAKDWAAPKGRKRYYRALGFAPRIERLTGRSADDVLDQASELMGQRPDYLWESRDDPEWKLPPSLWASWPG
jgi:hypothetical protein